MKLTIHDVGHGQCISLQHDNGNIMLWDCGHQGNYRPSIFLPEIGINKVDYFFVTNYDDDHISDLPNLRNNVRIRSMCRNESIAGDQLQSLKLESGPLSSSMISMIEMINRYTGGPLDPAPEFPNVSFRTFHNSYGQDFQDTNNISLVTLLTAGDAKFIIPGDLELGGWEALLDNQDFVSGLSDVNVFVASHHGRENGFCADVFEYCSPDVVIISDSNIKYATQEMVTTYSAVANGIPFNGETRYVLTTRRDGTLTWTL